MTKIKIGTEVEWSCKIKQNPVEGGYTQFWNLQYDGSVRGKYDSNEFTTRIGSLVEVDLSNPKEGINKIVEQFRILVRNMEKIDVNDSQGLHFHVSGFQRKSVIFSQEFFDYFMEEYKKIAKQPHEVKRINTSERVDGHINFCQCVYNQGQRYRAINYIHAYAEWKTFEFRLFPSTKKIADYRRYLTMLVKCIAKFERMKVKKETYEAKDDTDSGIIKLEELVF